MDSRRDGSRDAMGVYVHIPFCSSRCDYCAFSTFIDKADRMDDYLNAVISEIEHAKSSGELVEATTVFVGGGTPSLVGASRLCRLLDTIPRQLECEVTIECNPETTTLSMLRSVRASGVTRISLGVQSLLPHVLKGLGRSHDPNEAIAAIDAVGDAEIAELNVDLIFGASTEKDADLSFSIDGVLSRSRRPDHVSAYALSVEPGTVLSKDRSRHPDDDTEANRYQIVDEALGSAGFHWYEVSNWAIPSHECRHNLSCWAQDNYLGFGSSAHSHRDGLRWRNVSSIDAYIARIKSRTSPVATSSRLSGRDRALEALELSLRTRRGVGKESLSDLDAIKDLVEEIDGRYLLTRKGRLLLNEVAIRLVA